MKPMLITKPVAAMDGHASTMGQHESNKSKEKKLKSKIILPVFLAFGIIFGAVVVTYFAYSCWKNEENSAQVFRIVLHDKSLGSDAIPLDIKVDPEEQLEYSRSPLEGADGRSGGILGLRDFKKGIVAYKEENGSQCFISKIETNSALHAPANNNVQDAVVEESKMYMYLNYTIHPFVLRLAAGDNIVKFCGARSAIWMIPVEEYATKIEDNNVVKHGRVRRACKGWGCEGISFKKCFWECAWVNDRRKCTRRCVPL